MAFDYHLPHTILSPKDFVDNVRIIFDGGETSYSLAIIEWEGVDRLAMRWNVARREYDQIQKQNGTIKSVGMPSSRGYPVWFVLPPELFDINSVPNRNLQPFLESLLKLN